jgi:hypothetical protein
MNINPTKTIFSKQDFIDLKKDINKLEEEIKFHHGVNNKLLKFLEHIDNIIEFIDLDTGYKLDPKKVLEKDVEKLGLDYNPMLLGSAKLKVKFK